MKVESTKLSPESLTEEQKEKPLAHQIVNDDNVVRCERDQKTYDDVTNMLTRVRVYMNSINNILKRAKSNGLSPMKEGDYKEELFQVLSIMEFSVRKTCARVELGLIEEENKTLQEFNIEAADVMLVKDQANVSRYQALEALKKSKGDIVDAILELTE